MIQIRRIEYKDNEAIATIIKNILTEYGAAKPGTAFMDNTLNNMFNAYQKEKSACFIAEENNTIVGGCGVAPLAGDDQNTAELQKMYVSDTHRGKGIGKMLLDYCLAFATDCNFSGIYLETLPNMKEAGKLYRNAGFNYVSEKMGETGHSACHVWMYKKL